MKHSIALVTGTTSGLGYAASSMLASEGYRQVIITGRSLGQTRETAARLAAETKTQVFTPLELDLNSPASVQSALAELVRLGQPIDFLLLNAGMIPGKKRVLTAAGVEASQAPLIGHHQLTVGLLRANLLSPNARIVIAGAEPARGGVPMFSYTDVEALAAKYHKGDLTAAMEALLRNGPNVKYVPNNAYADAKLMIAWWVAALARRLPVAWCSDGYQGFATS
jgi:NAD(P)-dependent dehydrogenase (short-subunit alcohol dehydrogenase family)